MVVSLYFDIVNIVTTPDFTTLKFEATNIGINVSNNVVGVYL